MVNLGVDLELCTVGRKSGGGALLINSLRAKQSRHSIRSGGLPTEVFLNCGIPVFRRSHVSINQSILLPVMTEPTTQPAILTIAGSDSSGGAGIQVRI